MNSYSQASPDSYPGFKSGSKQVDVLILGAGPAGLSAGIVLASEGLRVLVCEQKRFPVDKACGEGVMPTGVRDLERLGVAQFLKPGAYRHFFGIRYYSPAGRAATGVFREGSGLGIPRCVLSNAFLQRASEMENLEILEGVRAKPVAREAGRITVQAGRSSFSTRLLVGADGLNSTVRHWAGLQGPRPRIQRWGMRQHFAVKPWSDYVEVYWAHGLEAYVTPCGERLVGLTFLWNRENGIMKAHGGEDLYRRLLQEFPALVQRLEGVEACDAPRASGPMQRFAKGPIADGALLIGDAAGYLDALTGEGISLATAQALALRETLLPALSGAAGARKAITARDLNAYRRAYGAIVRPYKQVTRLALFINSQPRLAEGAIAIFRRFPRLFQILLSANMGSQGQTL